MAALSGRRETIQFGREDVAMEVAVRQTNLESRPSLGRSTRRCPQCREATLVMRHRHVSPSRLGVQLVTEYYDCDFCDAQYQYSPETDRWKPIYL